MPRKGPESKERGAELHAHLALTLGPSPLHELPDLEELEEAWQLHRAKLIDGSLPCRRPWGYWLFEDVPDELRSELPKLERVRSDEPASKLANARRAVELERELARLEWLALSGKLSDEELRDYPRIERELSDEHLRALAR